MKRPTVAVVMLILATLVAQGNCLALLLWVPQQPDTANDVPRNSVPQNAPCADQPQSMNELLEWFDKGRIPSPREMTGSWVAIGFFFPDEIPSLNCDGVVRGRKFEWAILANQYSVEMDIIGTHHQKTRLKRDNRSATVTFPVDFEGDSIPVYRCRLTLRGTLACIVESRGVEFKKMRVKR